MPTTKGETPTTIPPPGTTPLTQAQAMHILGVRERALRNHVQRGAVTQITDPVTGERRYCVPEATVAKLAGGVAGTAPTDPVHLTTEGAIGQAVAHALSEGLKPFNHRLERQMGRIDRLAWTCGEFESEYLGTQARAMSLARESIEREIAERSRREAAERTASTLAAQAEGFKRRWDDVASVRARLAELVPRTPLQEKLRRFLGGKYDQ